MRLVFDEFEFCDVTLELTRDGEAVKLEPQTAAMLDLLLANRDRVVSKEELIEQIWAGRQVSDSSIENRISATRSAVGDSGREQKRIKTFPNRGFRFVATVEALDPDTDADSPLEPVPEAKAPWYRAHSRILTSAVTVLIGAVAIPLLSDGFFQSSETAEANRSINDEFRASIAVMPFRDISAAGDQDYLAEGISSELSGVLSRIDELKVSSRTSTYLLAERDITSAPEIGEALGVEQILEGSVLKEGAALRVAVQLVDARTNQTLWSKTFNRNSGPSSLIRIQEEMASAIVLELFSELGPQYQGSGVSTQSAEAYDLYLQAEAILQEQKAARLPDALTALERAVEVDPDFLRGHAALARTYHAMYAQGLMSEAEVYKRGEAVVAKVTELDPNAAETLSVQGLFSNLQGNWENSIVLLQRALAKAPNDSVALGRIATAYNRLGRAEERLMILRRARELDPLNEWASFSLSGAEFNQGNLAKATQIADENLRWNPEGARAHYMRAELEYRTGSIVKSHALFQRARDLSPDYLNVIDMIRVIYLDVGMEEEALTLISPYEEFAEPIAVMMKDRERVADYIASKSDPGLSDDSLGWIYYNLEEFDRALPHVKAAAGLYPIRGPYELGIDNLLNLIHIASVLKYGNDPDGDLIIEKIEQRIAGYTPQSNTILDVFIAAAAVRMIKGDKAGAMKWIDGAMDKGFVFLSDIKGPIYASVRGDPDFKSRLQRMETIAAEYRAQFREDLAETNVG